MIDNYKRILVGLDGSRASEYALEKAAKFAKATGGTLFIARVLDTRVFQSQEIIQFDYTEPMTESLTRSLDEYKKKVENDYGVKNIETILHYGSPGNAMARILPEEYGIDLIVIGATGQSAVERVLLGSVAERVTRHASCDVLIARP